MYTPSDKGPLFPAGVGTGSTILFAHPMFTQYRENAPLWCKKLVSNALDKLLEDRIVRHNGPSSLVVNVRHQPQLNRYCIHLLSYIPIRRSEKIDVIEDRTVVYNVKLKLQLPREVKVVRTVVHEEILAMVQGSITVPQIDGYEIVVLEYDEQIR